MKEKSDKRTKSFVEIEALDQAHQQEMFAPKHLYQYLGLTRETLRYYEKIHLLQPDISPQSQYRSFSFDEILKLFYIEFYKKRAFTTAQIKDMMTMDHTSLPTQLQKKKLEIKAEIQRLTEIEAELSKDEELWKQISTQLHQPQIVTFPLYESLHQISSFSSIKEYDQVLKLVDENKELTSQLIREVSFDEKDGFQTSTVHVVRPCEYKIPGRCYLNHGKSVHVLVECRDGDESVMERMFYLFSDWMKAHDLIPLGNVYIQSVFMMYDKGCFVNYCHSWVLIK
ncbi:MerR family transcriptional regulator [[Eubacterium] hominis]|uniref:helix-turn-helix domain-containing protein n=1 Tax=[Eubacterium] hominis TaxID=2764325 RepID=UPI003A4D28DF